jgi:hypothetical protein
MRSLRLPPPRSSCRQRHGVTDELTHDAEMDALAARLEDIGLEAELSAALDATCERLGQR